MIRRKMYVVMIRNVPRRDAALPRVRRNLSLRLRLASQTSKRKLFPRPLVSGRCVALTRGRPQPPLHANPQGPGNALGPIQPTPSLTTDRLVNGDGVALATPPCHLSPLAIQTSAMAMDSYFLSISL
jgi:hypothetical protein